MASARSTLSDVRHSRTWRAAQHPNRLRAPGVGTAQGLVVVRFGEHHNMQCDGQHRSTICCGLELVPHTGFEPMVSALRGRCPGPLDECGAGGRAVEPPRPGEYKFSDQP